MSHLLYVFLSSMPNFVNSIVWFDPDPVDPSPKQCVPCITLQFLCSNICIHNEMALSALPTVMFSNHSWLWYMSICPTFLDSRFFHAFVFILHFLIFWFDVLNVQAQSCKFYQEGELFFSKLTKYETRMTAIAF